jgi:hypothetical protein
MDNLSNRARRLELRIALAVVAIASICVAGPIAIAQDSDEWQGSPAVVGDWFVPANWTAGVPNSQLYSAVIDNDGTAKIPAGSAASGLLQVGLDHSGTLILDSGRLDLTYSLLLGNSVGSQGTVQIDGGALKVQSLSAGIGFGSGAVLQNNGSVDALFLELGGHGNWGGFGEPTDFGKGEYRLINGTLNSSQLIVGNAGAGTMHQSGGNVTVSVQLKVGGVVGSESFPIEISPIQLFGNTYSTPGNDVALDAAGGPSLWSVSTDSFMLPPTPSVGLYDLTGGSLTSPNLLVDHTGTFRQSGGNHQERIVQINDGGRYEFTGGTLNIASGLAIDGIFDFGHTASALHAGSAILDLSHGLANAESARIQAGPESLTIFAPGFRPHRDLGSFQTQGLTHVAGTDLVLHTGERFRGWGAIDDKVIAAGSIIADDGNGLGGISLNDGLVLKPGANVDLEQGQVTVKDDETAIRGGTLKAASINIVGTTHYNPAATAPSGDVYYFETPTVTPGIARQTGGTVDIQTLRIDAGRYVINDGNLQAATIYVGGNYNFNPPLMSSKFVQTGGRVVADSINIAPAFAYLLTTDLTNLATNEVSTATLRGSSLDAGIRPLGSQQPSDQSYEMRGGSLLTNQIYLSGGFNNNKARFHQTGGDLEVTRTVEIFGQSNEYRMEGGSLHARRIEVGSPYNYFPLSPMNLGTLTILDRASKVEISGELLLGNGAHFSAPNGATIQFTQPEPLDDWPPITGDSLAISTTNSDDVSGLAKLKVIFEGGLDSTATLEAAGNDLGPGNSGYLHNFALGTLQVGGIDPAKLTLVQNYDNQTSSDGAEAVYVDHLIVHAGSVLDLAGINLYYHTADIAPSAIVNGTLLRVAAVPEADTAILAALALYFGVIPMGRRRRI